MPDGGTSPPTSAARPANPLERLTSGGWAKGLLRLAVGIALVAVVLHVAGGDSLERLRDPALLPAVIGGAAIHLVQRAARIRKWQLMLRPTGVVQRSFTQLLRIQLIGMVANIALPVSEGVKVWAVSKDGTDVRISAKSIVVDMAMHTALIGAAGVIAGMAVRWNAAAIWGVTITMLLAPLAVITIARRWPTPPAHRGAILDAKPSLWLLAGLETAGQLSIYALAFDALQMPITTVQVLALAPVLYIVDLLNFTPSGLGLREALFASVVVVLPATAGAASSELGVATGLVISSMLLLATMVGGGLALLLPASTSDGGERA